MHMAIITESGRADILGTLNLYLRLCNVDSALIVRGSDGPTCNTGPSPGMGVNLIIRFPLALVFPKVTALRLT